MKALIVEDEFISRTLLSEYLAPYAQCVTAETGIDALDIISRVYTSNDRFDLVCLDIVLPGVNGHEVLSTLRQIERQCNITPGEVTTVFMTTALDDAKNIMNAFTLGQCQAYLIKPIYREKLENHLREFLLPH